MGKTHINSRKLVKPIMVVLLVVFLVSACLLLLSIWEKYHGRFQGSGFGEDTLKYNGVDYVLKDDIETFLVLGLDKYEGASSSDSYNNDKQADFVMLLVFDHTAETCATIHINRDTMANVNVLGVAGNRIDTITQQLALAHTYGNGEGVSCRNVADAVSDLLLGVRVNHYISLTMDAVPVMNDLVGGVEVTVLDDFAGIDDTLVKGETVTLMGEQALRYVRTRQGLEDSSNATRMKRQQQYVTALYNKTLACMEADDEFIVSASLEMSDYIVSDRSITQLQELIRRFSEYETLEISEIEGDFNRGEEFLEFYPDVKSIEKLVVELFYTPKT